jgi:hypothetical protein
VLIPIRKRKSLKNSPQNYHDEGWASVWQMLYDICLAVFFLGEYMKPSGAVDVGRTLAL